MPNEEHLNFIEQIIEKDLADGTVKTIATRFPPEPNGYLHIGHAKSICLNYGLAKKYNGNFTLRFDDTNPSKEETEYVENIIADVEWLTGEDMTGKIRYASDYFDQMYHWAEQLIAENFAYVCDQTLDQMRDNRGTPDKPMIPSAGRQFTPEQNLKLFREMRDGRFNDGERTLRAKIDPASPNFNLRDPVMYRILKQPHHRQGDKWCIYPMYDWAHGLEDSIEQITHSICTLEFEHHRVLYNWFLDLLGDIWRPHQYEFARLNLTYTVMSKRKLLELVKSGGQETFLEKSSARITGWDDPRMPTICGYRRRGYTPEAIRNFCKEIGVAKFNSTVDVVKLENAVRDDLNKRALRRMAVLNPVKLIIDNYPADTEYLEAVNNPENEADGVRQVPFTKELYIEADDFMEDAPKKYYRLTPGQEVRLRYAYYVKCTHCVKNAEGKVIEVHCTYDPATKGGQSPDGRKVQGTIHWVCATYAADAEVRLYDRLFNAENPDGNPDVDYKDYLNADSLQIVHAKVEPALKDAQPAERYQFERIGYFCLDVSQPLVFNRTVSLRDSWAKMNK